MNDGESSVFQTFKNRFLVTAKTGFCFRKPPVFVVRMHWRVLSLPFLPSILKIHNRFRHFQGYCQMNNVPESHHPSQPTLMLKQLLYVALLQFPLVVQYSISLSVFGQSLDLIIIVLTVLWSFRNCLSSTRIF